MVEARRMATKSINKKHKAKPKSSKKKRDSANSATTAKLARLAKFVTGYNQARKA